MRWSSWLPRSHTRQLSVLGLDIGPEDCRVVVLSGSSSQPDRLCCADRLALPEGLVAHGEVLQSVALGQWLRTYVDAGDDPPTLAYIGLDRSCVSSHRITLSASLTVEDVAFQLQAEVQSVLPELASEVCIDYTVDTEPAPQGEQSYWVQAVPRAQVDVLQRMAQAAGLIARVVEPRDDAARRTEQRHALTALAPGSVALALALQCEAAFGLALRAWHDEGINFLPYRQDAKHVLHRAWVQRLVVCAVSGAFLAAGFALVMALATENHHLDDAVASARAFDEAHKAHAQVKVIDERRTAQTRWFKAHQELQAQSLQWSHVLSHAAQGVWVASVKQQGTRWTVQGEALSSHHAQQLVQQLKTLDIWSQAPELPQLQVAPAATAMGVPVWQFRIEADLKVGV